MDYNCCYYCLFTVIAKTVFWRCFSGGGCQSCDVAILRNISQKRQYFNVPLLIFSCMLSSLWGAPWRGCFFNYPYLLLLVSLLLFLLLLILLLSLLSLLLLLLQCVYLYIFLLTDACSEYSQIFKWRISENC